MKWDEIPFHYLDRGTALLEEQSCTFAPIAFGNWSSRSSILEPPEGAPEWSWDEVRTTKKDFFQKSF